MRFALVLKKACDTCQLVGPLVKGLQARNELVVYSQDDPFFGSENLLFRGRKALFSTEEGVFT